MAVYTGRQQVNPFEHLPVTDARSETGYPPCVLLDLFERNSAFLFEDLNAFTIITIHATALLIRAEPTRQLEGFGDWPHHRT